MNHERAVFSALVALTRADGMISSEERAWLREFLHRAGLGGDEQIDQAPPVDREALRRAAPDLESRRTLLKLLIVVSMSDGSMTADEAEFLSRMAEDLKVPADQLEELRRQTVLVVDPEGGAEAEDVEEP